jgi:hypothetical protein
MGTRNVTMVIESAETKIAQYGQWDGYPRGQGLTALKFLRSKGFNLKKFTEKIRGLRWLTDKEVEKVNADPNWTENYPYLSRDAGAQILEMVYKKKVLGLVNNEEFVGDGLMCEWAYVIDLDKKTFEVYKGFNVHPVAKNNRFAKYNKDSKKGEYFPPRLIKKFSLDKLPTIKEFMAFAEKADK